MEKTSITIDVEKINGGDPVTGLTELIVQGKTIKVREIYPGSYIPFD